MACNSSKARSSSGLQRSFNPWRVFSWLATERPEARLLPGLGFNPWRVFSWLATAYGTVVCLRKGEVSIPGGFFRGLQRISGRPCPRGWAKFQSLAGFFVACNRGRVAGAVELTDLFQSLAGFFVACNGSFPFRHTTLSLCFNPWRVFSWLATLAYFSQLCWW